MVNDKKSCALDSEDKRFEEPVIKATLVMIILIAKTIDSFG